MCWNKYLCQKLHLSVTPGAKLPQMWIVLLRAQTSRLVSPFLFRAEKVFSEMAAGTELAVSVVVFLKYNVGRNCRRTDVILQEIIANINEPVKPE